MSAPWTDQGHHEGVKAAVHGALLGLAAVCLLYNSVAWIRRRERHLLINTLLYGGLVGLEVKQVSRHLR